jgi:osmotically inducible protein OsmC
MNANMSQAPKILFTGRTHTVVNHASASDAHGNVDLNLSSPDRPGRILADVEPHPLAEQLFAGAWSACYITALGIAADKKRVKLPDDLSVDIQVDVAQSGAAWVLQAKFDVRMPGVPQDVAEKIAQIGHDTCPYSKATHGNIDVLVNVTT